MTLSYSPIFFIAGTLLIWLVVIDVVATNTTKIGEGILTKWWQQQVCRLFCAIYQRLPNRSILVWSGAIIVLGMVIIWILLLWIGWVAIFCSSQNAIVNSSSHQPADFWARVYFAGFSISGLGTGDFIPQGSQWQVLTAIASLNGLLLTSLIIGFIVPIAQAEAQRRRTALTIFYTGQTAQELLLHTWESQQQTVLDSLLDNLIGDLIELDQKHASFPVLHRFCNYRRKESIALAIASLDEALTIAELSLIEASPKQFTLARRAISGYLSSLKEVGLKPAKKAPPEPTLDSLRAAKLPAIDDALWLEKLHSLQQRRKQLLALVEQSGWSWEHIHQPSYEFERFEKSDRFELK